MALIPEQAIVTIAATLNDVHLALPALRYNDAEASGGGQMAHYQASVVGCSPLANRRHNEHKTASLRSDQTSEGPTLDQLLWSE